jgi:hypothetical protein
MSVEYFTVDGTLIEVRVSLKSQKSVTGKDGDDKKGPPPDDPGNPTIQSRMSISFIQGLLHHSVRLKFGKRVRCKIFDYDDTIN